MVIVFDIFMNKMGEWEWDLYTMKIVKEEVVFNGCEGLKLFNSIFINIIITIFTYIGTIDAIVDRAILVAVMIMTSPF